MKQYNLTQAQQEIISAQLNVVGSQLLTTNFQDPALDHQNIRHHAYLSGKFAVLKALLEDDFPEPEIKTEGE